MRQTRPFSKLKKIIEGLFDPKLNMTFNCISYPVRSQWGNNAIPRFYLKMGKENIWDFPKDFKIKEEQFYVWASKNHISDLVREYIDTPLDQLLHKEFEYERVNFTVYNDDPFNLDEKIVEYKLTPLFKASDRRLGRNTLLKWAKQQNNLSVDKILDLRFSSIIS